MTSTLRLVRRRLVTIVTEAALEPRLLARIEALGAEGWTITEARGRGRSGERPGAWGPAANVRIEVLCETNLALAIVALIRDEYHADFATTLFLSEVDSPCRDGE